MYVYFTWARAVGDGAKFWEEKGIHALACATYDTTILMRWIPALGWKMEPLVTMPDRGQQPL